MSEHVPNAQASGTADAPPVTLRSLRTAKSEGRPIVMMTAYEAGFARLAERNGVDVLLVGDSLGMVVQGQRDTLAVTVDEMVYHTQLVRRGVSRAKVIADLPFLADRDLDSAMRNAGRLIQEGGADMVKLEGGRAKAGLVRGLVEAGIPVCAHVGLLPQQVRKLGGYIVQGRNEAEADQVVDDALAMVEAGAAMLVVECVPAHLGKRLAELLPIPVIGIGAGVEVDGQVLVMHDLLGMNANPPRFVRDFLSGRGGIAEAFAAYAEAVRQRTFPTAEESFA